ncbi:mitotic checkpoint regulator, MAD2B-interacting-domain-containing protein [Mrakia frigida]|uniref:PRCC domain-containing protein n=1 Tax=Mrakia frigida TaxID=29902 RepID=UPI003FCC1D6A
MALVDYGSDSEGSDDEQPTPITVAAPPPPLASAKAKQQQPKSTPAPPPPPSRPAPSSYASTSGLNLPPPKVASRKRTAPKFTLEPTSSIPLDAEAASSSSSTLEPPTKRAKVVPPPGSGSSALLSMLPAPKLALPQGKAMPKPVVLKPLEVGLDGRIETFAFERDGEEEDDEPVAMDFSRKPGTAGAVETKKEDMKVVKPLDWKLKSVVAEKKAPVLMDFFGMGSTSTSAPKSFVPTSSSAAPSTSSSAPSAASSSISITSAPLVPTFVPPEPTSTDAYPGYYLHPKTKEWAAYDPEYYNSFWNAWKEEEKKSKEGKEGKGWKGLDTGMGEVEEFKVADQGLGAGGSGLLGASSAKLDVPAPKTKGGSKHAQRNQLSSLVANAQSNRSALEEQIATAKRNKRAAGQAYGF